MANPPDVLQKSAASPAFKSINCPECGAPITLRALGASVMVACPSCRSQIDVSRPEIQVIEKFQAAAHKFELPLGARGKLRGQTYVVVGAMVRISDGYSWHEFLLFNPYIGFRWLILDDGHWSLAQTIKDVSAIAPSGAGLDYRGRSYRKYQAGTAVVDTVIGEFYWRVKAGDEAQTADFVAAPWMLSREKTTTEITWSLIQYLGADEVADAFHVAVPEAAGVAPNQPCTPAESLSRIKRMVFGALALALVIQIATMVFARETRIPIGTYVPPADHAQEVVFGPLHFDARHSLNELNASAPLDNSWVDLDYALVKKDTGESFEFGNTMEFYSGRDSDGAWTDGSRSVSTLLSSLPQGEYDLVVDSTSGDSNGKPLQLPIELWLTHDVAPWRNFWIACAAILAYPLYLMYRRLIFERQRWSVSQYDPYPRKTA